ncbi:uncharacterized protein LOC119991044 isoform X2 [Tripterygium wilfordii]|uniref:uncharacterized protein LOC119991044 isoform X2 n=1 Tax=Tripterygium wilfordii TaxID=458696 RepID=UPI0018F823E3|nr:uncharacterized protein LOC119991044 isoform X2 [Tripterygium wilfordii]
MHTIVTGDGHCGYRVIASYLGLGDDGWKKVCLDLLQDLKNNHAKYNKVLSPLTSTEELTASVDCMGTFADVKHWMTMPSMGNVISSCYKIAVVHISDVQCLTFFPLRDPPPFEANNDILTIGYINGSHFVRLELTTDSPLPPVSKIWLQYSHRTARHWITQYTSRIDKFKSIMSAGKTNMATVEIIA